VAVGGSRERGVVAQTDTLTEISKPSPLPENSDG
jgi:hypothetical protein